MQTGSEMFSCNVRQDNDLPIQKNSFEVCVGNYIFCLKISKNWRETFLFYLWFFAGTAGEGF